MAEEAGTAGGSGTAAPPTAEEDGPGPSPVTPPRRLHPLSPVFDLFDRNVLAPGAVALGSGGLRILFAAAAVLVAFRILAWSRRTYQLDDSVLLVRTGVLSRNEQLVPCDRIQQVSLVQKLRHRLLGVASLRVEVAGGGRGSGVYLDVLGHDEATALQTALLAAKAQATRPGSGDAPAAAAGGDPAGHSRGLGDSEPQWVPTAWPVVRLSTRDLVVAGLTGSELLVVFAFVASLSQLAGDLPDLVPSFEGLGQAVAGPAVVAALVAAFLVVWLGSAVATSVFRDSGYALDLVGDELHLSRGLLDRKEAVLPLARVQAVQITASPLRRPFGYVSLRVHSASGGADQEDRRVSVPLLALDRLPVVLELLLPGSAALPPLAPSPVVARRRAIVRAVVVVAPVAAVVAVLTAPVGLVAFGAVVPAVWFGVLAYRGLGHAVGPHHLASRSGALVRRTVIVPMVRAQSTRVRSSALQRRVGLASCLVDIAGPGRRPVLLDVRPETADDVASRVVAAVGGR